MTKYLSLLVAVVLLFSCRDKKEFKRMVFPASMRQEIVNQTDNGKMIIYFHSGDCSFCYGQLLSISREYPGLPLISVCESSDTFLVSYYLDQIGFKGLSLLDSDSLFLKANRDILNTCNTFFVNADYSIIASGLNMDEGIKAKICSEFK